MTDGNMSELASRGGIARNKSLSTTRKSEIGRAAVEARWSKGLPYATHDGVIGIDKAIIACAVLNTTKRVLTQETFLMAIGRAGKAKAGTGSRMMAEVDNLPPFLAAENLKTFISDDLRESTTPIVYRTLRRQRAFGYDATLLPKVCEVYLRARDQDALLPNQKHIARACDILMRGLAHVGIIALVDEATGYQDDRARDALAKILEEFVAKELRGWVRTFKVGYYRELCRLRGWPFRENFQLPRYAGKLTDDLIYKRLAPGVRDELRRLNPPDATGRRKAKHFQWLTEDVGHPKLEQHLSAVTALMKAADDWKGFEKMIDRALPRCPDMQLWEAASVSPDGDSKTS